MEVTDNHYVIRVPRLAGYKTLVVNAAIAIWALAIAIWPELPADLVSPDSVGAWFDSGTAIAMLCVAGVNGVLRLMASGPAAPFKRKDGKGDPTEGERRAYDEGYDSAREDMRQHEEELRRTRIEAKLLGRYEGVKDTLAMQAPTEDLRDLLAKGSPRHPCGCLVDGDVGCNKCEPVEAVDEVRVESGVCAFPDCSCHIKCKDRVPTEADKVSFINTLASAAGVRAMLVGFLSPSLVLFAGLAIATLGGCAGRQMPSLGCNGVQDCLDRVGRW